MVVDTSCTRAPLILAHLFAAQLHLVKSGVQVHTVKSQISINLILIFRFLIAPARTHDLHILITLHDYMIADSFRLLISKRAQRMAMMLLLFLTFDILNHFLALFHLFFIPLNIFP